MSVIAQLFLFLRKIRTVKKIVTYLCITFSLISFAQSAQYVSPDLDKNVVYHYIIDKKQELVSPKGKFYHQPAYTNEEIEFIYMFNDGKDKIFSWKVVNYEHIHEGQKGCDCANNQYRKNILVFVRTDSLGRYKTINNLYQVKKNILDNISMNEKVLGKKGKEIFQRIKQNPEIIISDIEQDIINFFRYYGIEKNIPSITRNTRRTAFPFGVKNIPFRVTLNLENKEDFVNVILHNEFDRKNAQEEDYNISRWDKFYNKDKYQLIVDENYEYSKENSRLLSATVKVKEISNFHENGILNYQLSIIKKD